MSSTMKLYRGKYLLFGFLTLFIISAFILIKTDHSIRSKIREKSFAAPTEFYSSPKKFYVGQVYALSDFKNHFFRHHYRERDFGSSIQEGDFSLGNSAQCQKAVEISEPPHSCVTFKSRYNKTLFFLTLNEWNQITQVFKSDSLESVLFAETEAEAFAQYLGSKPTLQQKRELGQIPRYCLDAVVAIEDPDFLSHQGISIRGLLRAVVANLRNLRWSQGGSTITQQLVKNYFLTPEKTIRRKITEIIISLILEFRISKDDILETYLNIIYLGQQGVFEVRGYGSASEYYFQKPLSKLSLADCALMAAIVNSPGRFNPFRHKERALKRRKKVLGEMLKHQMVSQVEYDEALKYPLPKKAKKQFSASAPYFVDAVKKKLSSLGIKNTAGLKVYTTLDPQAQQFAQKAVRDSLKYFEKNREQIKKIRLEQKQNLEAALISSNPLTGEITALVGGRQFATSPYNRAIDGHRQVGSIIKPVVYLTALRSESSEGVPYKPMTLIENSPFSHEYDGQKWSPQNYDKNFSEPVPLFYALKESMNVPTARLGIQVGLENVISTARELGVTSELKAFPSLSLGAFELKPIEVLQVYSTISQLGKKQPLHIIKKVLNPLDELVYQEETPLELVGDRKSFAILIGMMKETLNSGTGRASRLMGFSHSAGGKTGTTSNTKDAWFAGFTPFHCAVVWVGYDKNIPMGLTGASGALPIWTNYMKKIAKQYANREFDFPQGVKEQLMRVDELAVTGIPQKKLKPTLLIVDENWLDNF